MEVLRAALQADIVFCGLTHVFGRAAYDICSSSLAAMSIEGYYPQLVVLL